MMKKLMAILMAALVLLSMGSAFASAPKLDEIEVKSNGNVEVEFRGKVQYKNVKVTIKDMSGKTKNATIATKDNDDLTFKTSGLVNGQKYSFTISGIRAKGTSKYTSMTGSFTARGQKTSTSSSSTALKIKKIESDAGDDEIEVTFNKKVEYKNAKIVVKNASGKKLNVKVLERDSDSFEIRASGLKAGSKYTISVSGVREKGSKGAYKSFSSSFTARND